MYGGNSGGVQRRHTYVNSLINDEVYQYKPLDIDDESPFCILSLVFFFFKVGGTE